MPRPEYDDDDMLTPGEVAALFRVDPKSASRWARFGHIPDLDGEQPSVIRTPGGHIRIRYKPVRLILAGVIKMEYNTGPLAIPPTPVTRS